MEAGKSDALNMIAVGTIDGCIDPVNSICTISVLIVIIVGEVSNHLTAAISSRQLPVAISSGVPYFTNTLGIVSSGVPYFTNTLES